MYTIEKPIGEEGGNGNIDYFLVLSGGGGITVGGVQDHDGRDWDNRGEEGNITFTSYSDKITRHLASCIITTVGE